MQFIGEEIRKIRKEKKITLKQLAQETGVSISFLSQLELGKCSATLQSLRKICDALQVSPTIFFEQAPQDIKTTLPFHYENLAPTIVAAPFQPMLVTLLPNENGSQELTHLGYEFIYVLEGELAFSYQEQKRVLQVGQHVMFSSTESHIWWNEGEIPTKFLLISSL